MPEKQLQEPRIIKAVDYLAGILLRGKDRRWEIGPLGHALHGLAMYEDRLFKTKPSLGATPVLADRPN